MSVLELFDNSPYKRVFRQVSASYNTQFIECLLLRKGLKLLPAKCQRELCWDTEQYKSFIIHSIETYNAGDLILYRHEEDYSCRYILDGQHRIHAWEEYMKGSFSIEYIGKTIYFSDFTERDISILSNRLMCKVQEIGTDGKYDHELTELIYNRFNFSGVAHKRK